MLVHLAYWNAGSAKPNAALALSNSEEYDIIAMQEPYINRQLGNAYCPADSHYQVVYREGRAAIYIHKRFDLAALEQETGFDWCRVAFGKGEDRTHVWSIYSPNQTGGRWQSPICDFAARPLPGRHILVGDFNTHHPLWDTHGRESKWSSELLAFMQRWSVALVTPGGVTTRHGHNQRDSTIDLAWASQRLRVTYEGDPGWTGSDHRSQLVSFDLAARTVRDGRKEAEGWNWQMMDKHIVQAEARNRLRWEGELATQEQLEKAFEWLTATLTEIASASTPKKTPGCGRGVPWWCPEVATAVAATKQRRREWRAAPSQLRWDRFQTAQARQKAEITAASTRSWRRAVAAASQDTKSLWSLERWARLRSWQPPEAAKMPELRKAEGDTQTARTHSEKAAMLAERFFPCPAADLTDIGCEPPRRRFTMAQGVSCEDVADVLRNMGSWKAAGGDNIATGLLKACGKPLLEVVAKLVEGSFALAYYPKLFRSARVVVIPKPNKTIAQKGTPGGWRPIALLSTVGKLVEAIISRRITEAAESLRLIPEGQMGNRAERSTVLAIRLIEDVVRTAWARGGLAALLQLDIKGAFDTVNYTRLIDTLRILGFPQWVLDWVRSFVEGRTVRLRFDGADSDPVLLRAGVPQGSPLSPILFVLYIASLYEALAAHKQIIIVGFADDTNLLAIGNSPEINCSRLEAAWSTCCRWAETRGMAFAPEKSELIHFTRTREPSTQLLRLGDATIAPITEARFLGVWINRKLRWGAHVKKVLAKMVTQELALSRLAASTWGCSFARAREIYTKVIRSALAYGAAAWHTPSTKALGPSREFAAVQNRCLRRVSGAYKATPIRMLETEAAVAPLHLYLNKRVAEFVRRSEETGKAQLIRSACKTAAGILDRAPNRRYRLTAAPSPIESTHEKQQRITRWLKDRDPDSAAIDDWNDAFRAAREQRGRGVHFADEPPGDRPSIERYRGLLKHEAAVLCQIRTGRVGLQAFLFKSRVPDAPTPLCRCGAAAETPEHVILHCNNLADQRAGLQSALGANPLRTKGDLAALLDHPLTARTVVKWVLATGRIPQYRLAEEIGGEAEGLPKRRPRRAL